MRFLRNIPIVALLLVVAGRLSLPCLAQPYDPAPRTLRVMTWNVEWMFDDYLGDNQSRLSREQSAPSSAAWQSKLTGVADAIAHSQADIVALQEIEGIRTLRDLAQQLKEQHQTQYRYAFIQGSDTFTEQDVGFLVRGGLVSYRRHEQSARMFDSRNFYNLSKHLVAEFRWHDVSSPLTIMNVHLRATAEAEDKRVRQARLARRWLEPALARGEDVILLGDLNSEHTAGALTGEVPEITGPQGAPQMMDLLTRIQPPNPSTHLILDKQFDRVYVSESLLQDAPGLDWSFVKIEVLREAVIRGMPDGEEHWHQRLTMDLDELDLSDHFPVVATFQLR